MIALACALLGGAMFYLAQGLNDIWPLAWIAPVPLLWLAYGRVPAWQLFAAAFFAGAMGMVYFYQAYGAMLVVGGTIILIVNGALLGTVLLLMRAAWRRLPPLAVLLAFPLLWTACEFAGGWISPHGAWGAWGYTQVAWPAAIQIAAVTGVYGVTFLLCLFANGLALALRGASKPGALAVVLSLAVIAAGYVRLAQPGGPTLRVAALAEVDKDYIHAFRTGDAAAARAVADRYAAAIAKAAAGGTKVFVTPETGVEQSALPVIEAAARQTDSLVVTGAHGRKPARNMAVATVPGRPIIVYDKRHRLLPGESIYKPGTKSGVIGNGMAMAICKDLDFPRTIRSDAQAGIQLMMVPANDFTRDGWMHARQAVMRGVENGFAVTRTAFNGLETVSDAQGRILASARVDHFGFTAIQAEVPLGPGPTFYTRFGDWFAWLDAAGTLLLLLVLARRRIAV